MPYAYCYIPTVIIAILLLIIGLTVPGGRHYRKLRTAKKIYGKIQNMDEECVIPYLKKIDPYVFEELVLLAFKKRGYKIYRNRQYSGDGGIDGKVRINGRKVLIQDKRYKNYVSLAHVQAFDELCRKKHRNGLFVHTGKTGEGCRDLGWESPRIEIISGQKLIRLLIIRYDFQM